MESWAPATSVPAFTSTSSPPLDDIALSSSATRSVSMAGTGGMFGMRDYRAHKFLWLLRTPLRVIGWLAYFALIAAAIALVDGTGYAVPLKILIAFVAWFFMSMLAGIVVLILDWFVQRVFFFLVDVTPARGETVADAKQIALYGDLIWLNKKFDNHIEDWTQEDTDRLASLLNWRARWFLKAGERLEDRVDILQRHYKATGQRPADMSEDVIKSLVGHLNDWREWLLIPGFSSVIALVIIVWYFIAALP